MEIRANYLKKQTNIILTADEREAIRTVSNLIDQILCATMSIPDFHISCQKKFLFDKDGLINLCRNFDYMRTNTMVLDKLDE